MADDGHRRATVRVDLGSRSYDILIGRGLIDEAGVEIARCLPGARAAIVTDQTVADLHLRIFEESLNRAGIQHHAFAVRPGEQSKSFPTLQKLADDVLATHLERTDVIIAFGGGVVGDLAGFLAAIIRRGMRYVQVPTTLLAQVDSSVGGKTGINTAIGKNLVGLFNQPALVIADVGILDSLPPRIFNAGYAEVAKYGLIGDAGFFAWLEKNWRAVAAGWPEREHAIAVACRAKAATVAADERDEGERALLNFGHTFGHALEAATGYSDRLLHGEAVSIGMCVASRFSARLGLCPPEDVVRTSTHLADVGLPTRIADIAGPPLDTPTLMRHMAQDKKVTRGQLNFILTRGIGSAFIARDLPAADVSAFLETELSA